MESKIGKNIAIGAVAGLIANIIGIVLFSLIFIKGSLKGNLISAYQHGDLGKLISIGATLNLIAFFLFIRAKRYYRARGVLLLTILMAVIILVLNFL